jgi:hypothetical protein
MKACIDKLIFVAALVFLTSCDANLKTKTRLLPTKCQSHPELAECLPVGPTTSTVETTSDKTAVPDGVYVALVDQQINVTPFLKDGDRVFVGKTEVVVSSAKSGEKFVTVSKSNVGNVKIVRPNGQEDVIPQTYALGNTNYPLITAEPSVICSSISFYNVSGIVTQGTKNCDISDLKPENIRVGITISGVQGLLPNPDLSNLKAENIKSGITIAGVSGAIDLTNLTAANIKSGVTIAGVAGTSPTESHLNCSADGSSSCVVDGTTYIAAAKVNVITGNIKSGVTIGGVTGSYPSTLSPLAGASATSDLTAFGPTVAVGSYEFFDSAGVRYTGTVADGGTITPTTTNQVFSTAGTMYRAFTVVGDTDLTASNIKDTIDIFSVTGNVTPTPGSCASNGLQNCVATGSYFAATGCAANGSNCYLPSYVQGFYPLKAIDYDDIESNKAKMQTSLAISGISGTLADCNAANASGCVATSTFKTMDLTNMDGGGALDLTALTFNTRIVSASPFEYWDQTGTRHTGAGDADLVNTNIKNTVAIFAVTGNVVETPANCGSGGSQDCVATGSYYAATSCATNGSTCFIPAYVASSQPLKAISYDAINTGKGSIRTSLTLGGDIAGTLADCNGANQSDCVATSTFKTMDLTTSSGTGLTSANFNTTIATAAAFEFWTAGGARQQVTGDSDLANLLNIRSGIDIFGYVGTYNPPVILPQPPTTLTASYGSGPDHVNLSWSAVSGASGYILMVRTGSAVLFTPTHTTTYTTGAQGSDTILYVGAATSYSQTTGLAPGSSYHYAVYSYDANHFYSASSKTTSETAILCASPVGGGTWIPVPGDADYGTPDFCVMKYVATNASGVPTSQPDVAPWVSITQTSAISTCAALGAEYHLMTNPEWMTIAANAAAQNSNWSGGTVGLGQLYRGHSDNSPNFACAASSNDLLAWVETDCTAKGTGGGENDEATQRRTHTLSNGQVIWDMAGNVWKWVDYYNASDKPTPNVAATWYEYTAVTGSASMPMSMLIPTNAVKPFWQDSWTSSSSIGKYYPGVDESGGALLRGAPWADGASAGLFTVHLGAAPSSSGTNIAFRCVFRPASP